MTIRSVQLVRRVSSPVGTITLTARSDALVGLALNGPTRTSSASTTPSASGASTGMGVLPTNADVAASADGEVDDPHNHDSFLAAGLLDDVSCQLGRYFDGGLRSFEVNLDPPGTEFQCRVWRALCEIPYGETRSYSDIASAVGQPKAARAVGMANNRNPIALIIPCHRVVGADGSLTGYAAGLKVKEGLLNLEQAFRRERSEAAALRICALPLG
ncbi:MAG: methylated-DNA--[protein]-cysteine S-methyltransferase [Acidimicrobiales bacterium]